MGTGQTDCVFGDDATAGDVSPIDLAADSASVAVYQVNSRNDGELSHKILGHR